MSQPEKENFENNEFDQRFRIAPEDCEVRRSPERAKKATLKRGLNVF